MDTILVRFFIKNTLFSLLCEAYRRIKTSQSKSNVSKEYDLVQVLINFLTYLFPIFAASFGIAFSLHKQWGAGNEIWLFTVLFIFFAVFVAEMEMLWFLVLPVTPFLIVISNTNILFTNYVSLFLIIIILLFYVFGRIRVTHYSLEESFDDIFAGFGI